MTNLLRFIIRFQTILLFLLLEIISFIFIFYNSNYQKTKAAIAVSSIKGELYQHTSKIRDYFTLSEQNKKLIAENEKLKNELNYYVSTDTIHSEMHADSLRTIEYRYIAARVINNSVNKMQNLIMLNIGSKYGVKPEMGVITANGIAGMIIRTSDNYAVAISVLNCGYKNFKFSGKLKRSGDYGTISWNGANYNTVQLSDIARQVDVQIGDTIVTNQHSEIFPDGIMIGTVENIKIKDGTFFDIDVHLSQNMKSLHNVYVVDFPEKDQVRELLNEKNTTDKR